MNAAIRGLKLERPSLLMKSTLLLPTTTGLQRMIGLNKAGTDTKKGDISESQPRLALF
jgi:hypothetical protein